mgnify:FL=1
MWTLTKRVRFEASHVLPNHEGKCGRIHGHSWVVEVEVRGVRLHMEGPVAGMIMDFSHIGGWLQSLVDEFLDHQHLNDTTGLTHPTSEALAEWMFLKLTSIPNRMVDHITAVTIEETCTCRVRYEP